MYSSKLNFNNLKMSENQLIQKKKKNTGNCMVILKILGWLLKNSIILVEILTRCHLVNFSFRATVKKSKWT
jgi:hypothetical protein